jgi:hypothetical protein
VSPITTQSDAWAPERSAARSTAKRVAVRCLVAECAEREPLVDAVVAQLDLRHRRVVAGQQRDRPARFGRDALEQRLDARQDPPASRDQQLRRSFVGGIPERRAGAGVEHHFVAGEDVGQDQGVGPPGERDPRQIVADAVMGMQDVGQRLAPGAIGLEQGAVDVEQQNASGHGGFGGRRGVAHVKRQEPAR